MKVRIAISRLRAKGVVTTRYYMKKFTLVGWQILYNNGCPVWFSRLAEANEWIRLYEAIKRR